MMRAERVTSASPPLPPFRDPFAIIRSASRATRPPGRVRVSECAAQYRRLNDPGKYQGPWLNAKSPMLVEPMDVSTSRAVGVVVFAGPAQFGKTEWFLNFLGHGAKYRPGDVLVFQPTKDAAADFAARRVVNRLLRPSPEFWAELGANTGDDLALSKTYKNGSRHDFCWPTATQFASRTPKSVLIDERDRMVDDVEGEGDPIALAKERIKTHGRDGKVLVTSSVSRPETAPGILQLFYTGDQRLWFVRCPSCGVPFSPGFDEQRKPTVAHLYIAPDATTPEEAADKARLVCPSGCQIEPRHKAGMNAGGRWVALGETMLADGTIDGVPTHAGRVRSYWLHGLSNPFEAWSALAHKLVAAEQTFARTGEETELKTAFNAGFGMHYRSRAAEEPLDAAAIAGRGEAWSLGTVPAGVRYLTAAVDIAKSRFDVLVEGHDERGETWLIDRFALRQVPGTNVDLSPATHPEHWRVLFAGVFDLVYPLADDPARGLPIACVGLDTQGVPGTSDNARLFWLEAIRRRVPTWRIMMLKGASVATAPALRAPTYEGDRNGKPKLDGYRWYVIGVHTIKDTIANKLRRVTPGPGYVHFPRDFKPEHYAELAAETRDGDEWVRRGANETWDLMVYNWVTSRRLKPHRFNFAVSPPAWAAPRRLDGVADAPAVSGPSANAVAIAPALPRAAPPVAPIKAMAAPAAPTRGVRGRVSL